MSLLNDMLRDLSATQKPADRMGDTAVELDLNAREQRELLHQSSVIKPMPGTLLPSLAVFVVVLVLLVAWRQGFWLPANPLSASERVPESASAAGAGLNTTITTPELPAPGTAIDQPATAAQQDSDINAQAIVPEQKENVLDERLAALESAITRLSTAVEESNTATAETTAVIPAEDQAEIESVSIRDPFAPATNSSVSGQPETVQNEVIPADAHLSIAPNPVALDQRQAEQARQLLAQGLASDAIISLQAFIAGATAPRESAKVLLDIFSSQENALAINNFLAAADYLSPVEQHFYAAKVAIIQQREADAIQLLEEQLPEANDQENYRALLAGLYQRAGKFQEATTMYRRLLTSAGNKPAYWLGFALAQDSLNQTQTARQAYLRLAEYADLQPQVRTYIQQRLAALQ